MKDLTILKKINQVIASFFEKNPSITKIRAKELMPYFIAAGIFFHDHKVGFLFVKFFENWMGTMNYISSLVFFLNAKQKILTGIFNPYQYVFFICS